MLWQRWSQNRSSCATFGPGLTLLTSTSLPGGACPGVSLEFRAWRCVLSAVSVIAGTRLARSHLCTPASRLSVKSSRWAPLSRASKKVLPWLSQVRARYQGTREKAVVPTQLTCHLGAGCNLCSAIFIVPLSLSRLWLLRGVPRSQFQNCRATALCRPCVHPTHGVRPDRLHFAGASRSNVVGRNCACHGYGTLCVLCNTQTRQRVRDTCLHAAAAGSTVQFAVQLAKQAGNHVIGTCSSDAKVHSSPCPPVWRFTV